jgi:hypothetical protein
MDDKVLKHLISKLIEIREDQAAFVAQGRAADFAEYRHTCGVIRGLSLAEQACNDLVQRLETDDDD